VNAGFTRLERDIHGHVSPSVVNGALHSDAITRGMPVYGNGVCALTASRGNVGSSRAAGSTGYECMGLSTCLQALAQVLTTRLRRTTEGMETYGSLIRV